MDREFLGLWIMATATGAGVWVLRLIGRHLERKHERTVTGAVPDRLVARLEELEQRVDAAALLEDRIAEVEERLDFSERMLAQHVQEQLPGERH
ncbi:MAG TPA: hypothetical protein VGA37_09515 [Gemmatimonadales bacterium]